MQALGERKNASLRETTVRDAGKAAMALYRLIETHGWERGPDEFRGETPPPRNVLTLGDYLTEVMATGEISPRTLRTYSTKVRRIAADLGNGRSTNGS